VIVEIGIFSGGSLAMWQSYFGAGAHVHGVDVEESCKAHADDSVTVWIGDQSDPAFWQRFLAKVPSFDIVIDDGGHEASQQMPTLEALLPRLSP
jgi:cephalosporin hydroxylase